MKVTLVLNFHWSVNSSTSENPLPDCWLWDGVGTRQHLDSFFPLLLPRVRQQVVFLWGHMVGVRQLHGTDQVFSEHLRQTISHPPLHSFNNTRQTTRGQGRELTSAGFFWLEAGVPGLLPFLLEEQKDVEGPKQRQKDMNKEQHTSVNRPIRFISSLLTDDSLSLSELSLLLEDLRRFIL